MYVLFGRIDTSVTYFAAVVVVEALKVCRSPMLRRFVVRHSTRNDGKEIEAFRR